MAAANDQASAARWRLWRSGPHIPSLLLFVIVAIALLGTAIAILTTVEAERVERQQVERTSAAIASLNDIMRATMNGETAQRGYFITIDERYLEPYYYGRSRYRPALDRLKQLLGTQLSPEQRDLVAEIERVGDAKWAELDGTISQVRQGQIIAAHNRILSDEGQLAMLALRNAVGRLQAIEDRSLATSRSRSAAAEARLLPALAALFVVIVAALGLGLWQVTRTARAEAAAANAATIAEARDRADLLARELNHRVKNLFAVILAIVRMTGKGDMAAKPVIDRITNRLQALVTAHEVSQGAPDRPVVDLAELVATAIAPYRSDSERCELDGGRLILSARLAVPIGLVLHELVTNAVKYGAWAKPGGLLKVSWRESGGRVRLDWEELCEAGEWSGEQADAREGFGSMLIRSSAQQLGGTIDRSFGTRGVVVRIDFPAEA
ncbi:sensor histidine kinase [Novosphingobium lentum]|uniref:sensor histidine kinase n=1 Tax=Novosphingobium lentum TaxID=145287 RepID=UPI00082AFD88|nr:CHASE3 domain-containing protein [Novosphingobium lentum]